MKATLILALLLFFFPSISFAQTQIKGHVGSSGIGPVANATIKIKKNNEGAITDTTGNYQLKTKLRGYHWIICSRVGVGSDSALVNINGDSLVVNFFIKEKKNQLAVVSITNGIKRINEVKRAYAFTDFDVVTTPGAMADVAAALQVMPGAAPAGNETGLFVHGGAFNETKAYFDGMLVKNPFGSRLPDLANRSRFSPFLFKETSFTTEGYAAEYGQALSSALLLETKGLPNVTSNEFAVTSLGGGAAHTHRFKNSALLLGANYYDFGLYSKLVEQYTQWKQHPKQYQGTLHYKAKVGGRGTFKVFADYSSTSLAFDINNPNSNHTDLLTNTNNNLYLNATYKYYLEHDWSLFAGVAYNATLEKGKVNTTLYDQRDNVGHEKVKLTKQLGKSYIINFGVEQIQNRRDEGYDDRRRNYADVLSASFTEVETALAKKLTAIIGARIEYSSYLKEKNISPRASILWSIDKKNQCVFSYHKRYQKPDDSFLAQSDKLTYEKTSAYTIDYQFNGNGRNLRIQGYYKGYNNLAKITTPVFSGFQAYGPPVLITDFNNSGFGYAQGIDLFYKDIKSVTGLEMLFAYSYLDTKRDYLDFPTSARPSFAPSHTLNLMAKRLILKYRGHLSATYTVSSGRSYFNPNNPNFMEDRTRINQNLSVGFSYMPKWFKHFTVLQISATNILGFKQIYGYRYAYDGTKREPILPPGRRQYLLSFLMNVGDGWFNH
jgi:hypothetical protein